MEQQPRHRGDDEEQRLPGEDLAPVELEPGQARRIIEDGIRIAEAAAGEVDDWVARHIALHLKTEDSPALSMFAGTGAIPEEFSTELVRDYERQSASRRRWTDFLGTYALHRTDRGPLDGWVERARLRDQFHTAWWDRDGQRGNRYTEGRDLDREIRFAQDARQVVGDELAARLLVRIAANPHGAVARFAADGHVTDELSQELQEKYLSGTEQERRWLSELGSWIAAKGEPSPVPWWRSPAPVEPAVIEQANPVAQAERCAAWLADLHERLAPLPDLGDIPRPPTGHGFGGGYEWMEEGLPEGWYVEPMWGRDGWNLGSWPYVIVALFIDDERERYAVTTYVEGDINAQRYKSRGALYVAVNEIAEWHWRFGQSRGPGDLPEGSGLLLHHTGPYPGWRDADENATGQ